MDCPICGVLMIEMEICEICSQPAWCHDVTDFNIGIVLTCQAIRCDPGGHVLVREPSVIR